MNELTKKINDRINVLVQSGELKTEDQILIIQNILPFLNLKTISKYAEDEGISYNGALDRIERNKVLCIELLDYKLIVDNN